MRTKLYVLGAVLGAAPGLLPVVSTLWLSPPQETRQESKGGSSRRGRGGSRMDVGAPGASASPGVASPPGASEASHAPSQPSEAGGAKHPCELITVIQVPCDASVAACEYTYWQCPEQVKPLRA
jgi:hypothetical protein